MYFDCEGSNSVYYITLEFVPETNRYLVMMVNAFVQVVKGDPDRI